MLLADCFFLPVVELVHGRQSEPEHGGWHTVLFLSVASLESRASPKKAGIGGGGGGGGSNPFFSSRPQNFGSVFQTQNRGTHRTSPTSLTSKKKGGGGATAPAESSHEQKGSSFQWIVIQPQNCGGGGAENLILCPPLKICGGGGGHVPPVPPYWRRWTCVFVSVTNKNIKKS